MAPPSAADKASASTSGEFMAGLACLWWEGVGVGEGMMMQLPCALAKTKRAHVNVKEEDSEECYASW